MFLRTMITLTATAGLIGALGSLPSEATSPTTHATTTVQVSRSDAPAVQKAPVRSKAAIYTSRLTKVMNDVRRKHHLVPLKTRPCLGGYATRWARHLARTGKFEHQSLTPMLRRCQLSRVGEILAKGNVRPRYMITMWMHSPGHRALLLDRRFRIAGVSARRSASGAWVGCIDFGRG